MGFSLHVFLPDGKPDGLRIVTRSHWTGVAVIVSRAEYPVAKDRPEFQATGVYALVGPGEDNPSVREIYLGEGDVVHTRIASHLANLDFWTEVIVFTKSDGTLNKAHVRYLEAELVAKARAAKRYRVRNGTTPSPPRPDEATTADLAAFLDAMLVIYRLVGVDAFDKPPTAVAGEPASEPLLFSLGGATGTGRLTSEGFLVNAGARASKTEKAGFAAGYHALRESLLGTGVLTEKGECLELTQDFVFTTPSSAGAVLYGGQVSGPQQWKYASGESLKERDQQAAAEMRGETVSPVSSGVPSAQRR